MKISEIAHWRLRTQGLSKIRFTDPNDVVTQLGAVQSQDYAGAKWALGQRLKDATEAEMDQAFNEGRILRTHVMRPTWHFVTPADIRWILRLTAPRVHAANAYMYRTLELDSAVFKRSHAILEKALEGGKHLTRAELITALKQGGISSDDLLRFTYLMMRAELDGVICSGPRRGKQFTYALLEERVPPVQPLERDAALAELLRRYFATRGPASLQDFVWWSGLTMADAKHGIEMVKSQFISETINGQTYWFAETKLSAKRKSPTAYLLPNYDEYFIGFKDRSAIGEVAGQVGIKANDPAFLAHIIILDGQIIGGWKRTINKETVSIELNLITKLTSAEQRAVVDAANRYCTFLGMPVELV